MIAPARLMSRLSLAIIAASLIAGCSDKPKVETRIAGNDHFVTKAGNPNAIDLPAVEKAFWETKAPDFNSWMGKFETRVNEIYDGGVVSLDARRNPQNLLTVTGYLEQNKQEGYQPNGDAKLFAIDQTDAAQNNNMAYNVSGYDGSYYPRSHSLLDNPFVQMMVIGSLLQRPYYTPYSHIVVLHSHQTVYRQTPAYQAEKTSRVRAFGTNTSQRAFGTTPMPAGTKNTANRSWSGNAAAPAANGANGANGAAGTNSAWGGRRASGTGTTPGTNAATGTNAAGSTWGGRRAGDGSTGSVPTGGTGMSGNGGTTSGSTWGGRAAANSGSNTGGSSWGGRSSSGSSGGSSWGGRRSSSSGRRRR